MRNLLIITFMFLTVSLSYGQNKVDFPKNVNLIKMTDVGVAIVGTDDALYGIDGTGKILWQNEKLKKVEAERVEILNGSELIFVSDKGFMSRNRVLNVFDGTEYANSGVKGENIFAARVIHGTNQLWVHNSGFNGQDVNVWDIENNTLLYNLQFGPYPISMDESAAMTTTFSGCQPITYTGEKSAILHLSLAQLGNYDLTTGNPIWMFDWKPYKVKKPGDGKGDKPSKPSAGFSVMKIDDADGTLYFPFGDQLIAIDSKTGSPKWDPKGGKTEKVNDMYITDEGVLVLTYKGLQLVNKSNGEFVWDKPIKIKGAGESLLIKGDDTFYAISKSSLIEIDVKNKSSKALTEKIKFQGGESLSNLEVFGDVIVLSSGQNAVGINKISGELIHTTYYKAPGPGLGTIAQNMALATVAMAATMNSYNLNKDNATSANGTSSFRYHQYTPRMMESQGSAQVSSKNITYISTKFKDSDASGFGLARVDTKTGEVTDKIIIDSREPIYAVDEDAKLIFFKSDKNAIEISQIN